MNSTANDIQTYISQFPEAVQEKLRNIRQVIKENAPQAKEEIAYGMPSYKANKKPLVYFAAFKNHVNNGYIFRQNLRGLERKQEYKTFLSGFATEFSVSNSGNKI